MLRAYEQDEPYRVVEGCASLVDSSVVVAAAAAVAVDAVDPSRSILLRVVFGLLEATCALPLLFVYAARVLEDSLLKLVLIRLYSDCTICTLVRGPFPLDPLVVLMIC